MKLMLGDDAWRSTCHGDPLAQCGQCVLPCRLRAGLKDEFPISGSLTSSILGYATLWFPLLGSFQPLHVKSPLLDGSIKIGTCLRNDMWGKFSPFLTLKCFGSLSLLIHAHSPLCQGQPMVESRMIQASVAR